jgi:hypothetical protein
MIIGGILCLITGTSVLLGVLIGKVCDFSKNTDEQPMDVMPYDWTSKPHPD